jgi:predicted hotdog family 3-hydroxylacyl-ACP dehydratase
MTDPTATALARMPHEGRMLLIERVLFADAVRIRCRAGDHAAANHPLRIDGRLATLALAEIGAQAAAAHASLEAVGGAHAGLVLAFRDLRAATDEVASPDPLEAEAEALDVSAEGARYAFRVTQNGDCLLSGVAMLSMRSPA